MAPSWAAASEIAAGDDRPDLLVDRHDRDPRLGRVLLTQDEGQQPGDDDGRDEEEGQRPVVAAQLFEQPPADGQRPTRPHGCSPADVPTDATLLRVAQEGLLEVVRAGTRPQAPRPCRGR